jgi:PKD repeat protein
MVDYTTKNPSHTYQAAGDYTVKLSVTNASGSDSEIKANYIKVTNPDMIAPSSIIPTTGFPIIALPVALIVGVLGAMLFPKSSKEN